MRFYLILASIVLFISGCASSISSLEGVDNNLPPVKNIRIMPDVGEIAFEWDAIKNSDVVGFAVYRGDKDGFKEIATINNPYSTHFVDDGLIPETQYQYYFYTLGHTHYSPRSEIVTAKTSFIDPVESIYASNDYPKEVKLIFSPHPNPSISHYLIQKEIDGRFKTISIVNDRLLAEFFDTGLKDGTSYKYRIIAVDFHNNLSRPSKIVIAKTKDKPVINTNLITTNNLINKIMLSWDPQKNIKEYNIYRSQTEQGKYDLIATTSGTSYTDNINESGKVYFYKVSGVDDTNLESEPTAGVKGSTKNIPNPPVIKRGYVDNKEVSIEWVAGKDINYYMLYRKNVNTGDKTRFRVKGTSFNDKDIINGNEYIYYVVAVDETGLESNPSNEIKLLIK